VSTLGDGAHPNALTRVVLVSHGPTSATRATAFPDDEPLSDPGRLASVDLGRITRVLCGPEVRCRQTAAAFGWDPVIDPALSDLSFGQWRGRPLAEIMDMSWLTDPAAAPHGGESVQDVVVRVSAWLDSLHGSGERVVAVAHPAVVRAAVVHVLNAPVQSFWRIDVTPLAHTRLSSNGARWTLRETGHPVTR
jgi:broad specificity phosphatase PhoE